MELIPNVIAPRSKIPYAVIMLIVPVKSIRRVSTQLVLPRMYIARIKWELLAVSKVAEDIVTQKVRGIARSLQKTVRVILNEIAALYSDFNREFA